MRGDRRRGLVLATLQTGEVDVAELSQRLGVSTATVRRDLQRLADDKAIRRTFGGAILAPRSAEASLGERQAAQGVQKRAIALAALDLVPDDATVILDAGSTVLALGALLKGRRLRIVTNNLALAPLLADEPGIELILLGGQVRARSLGAFGPLALEALSRITAERVFMSADGVAAGRGLCEASLDQTALKSLMMRQAGELVVLADASKLGRAAQNAWAPLPERWRLITDAAATDPEVVALARSGAQVTSVTA